MVIRRLPPITLSQLGKLQPKYQRRRLFVTGGMGYLGRHILNGPASENWNLIAPSSESLDLRYRDSVRAVIDDWDPNAIIHTAYRRNDRAAIVDASRNVAEAAERTGARLVHISTDAVFAGRAWPYTEDDPPTPIHDYGTDKADAELAVLDACPTAVVVRTSLLVGSGTMSPHEIAVRDAVSGRSDIEFFTDEIRCPILVDDFAKALVVLAERRDVTGVLHLGGPDALTRAELATLIVRHHDWDGEKLRFTTAAGQGLVRPGHVELDSTKAARLGLVVRGPKSWL